MMGRKRSGNQRSIVDKITSGVAVSEPEPESGIGVREPEVKVEPIAEVQPVADVPAEVTLHELTVPMGDRPASSFVFNLNIQLDSQAAAGLQQLTDGLDRERATLKNGTRIVAKRHAAMWLCEQLAEVVK